jgi:hypothetical protein
MIQIHKASNFIKHDRSSPDVSDIEGETLPSVDNIKSKEFHLEKDKLRSTTKDSMDSDLDCILLDVTPPPKTSENVRRRRSKGTRLLSTTLDSMDSDLDYTLYDFTPSPKTSENVRRRRSKGTDMNLQSSINDTRVCRSGSLSSVNPDSDIESISLDFLSLNAPVIPLQSVLKTKKRRSKQRRSEGLISKEQSGKYIYIYIHICESICASMYPYMYININMYIYLNIHLFIEMVQSPEGGIKLRPLTRSPIVLKTYSADCVDSDLEFLSLNVPVHPPKSVSKNTRRRRSTGTYIYMYIYVYIYT